MLIASSSAEQLGADLNDHIELADVQVALAPETNLDVARLRRPGPRLLRTLDGFGDHLGQEFADAAKTLFVDGVVVPDVDDGHPASLAHGAAAVAAPFRPACRRATDKAGPMSDDPVRAYYASMGEREWLRLDRPEGMVEFHVNTAHLAPHLIPGGRVLDLGGGPGRYAQWLAGRGHRVVLADSSPALLQIARERLAEAGVEAIVEADARNLSQWSDATFDDVLCLGPLYHLPDEDDRASVVAEVLRVVRPGGVVAFALMPVLAFLRRTLAMADERRHFSDEVFLHRLFERGTFVNDIPGRFTQGWGVRVRDIVPWFAARGIEAVALVASEGITPGVEEGLRALRDAGDPAFGVAMQLVVDTATDPSILGMASHLLLIGRAPTPAHA